MSGRYADDAASFAEMATDAGTRELIPDPGHVDNRPYDEPVETWEQRMERHRKLSDARKDTAYRALGMLGQLLRQGDVPDYAQSLAQEIEDEANRLTAELNAFWREWK